MARLLQRGLSEEGRRWCEAALAMRRGVPVISLGGWRVVDATGAPVPGIRYVETPEEAVALASSGDPDS